MHHQCACLLLPKSTFAGAFGSGDFKVGDGVEVLAADVGEFFPLGVAEMPQHFVTQICEELAVAVAAAVLCGLVDELDVSPKVVHGQPSRRFLSMNA